VIAPAYRNPPIAEALVEFRFGRTRPWAEVEGPLLEFFAKTHTGEKRKMETYQVQSEWKAGTVATQASSNFSRWILPNGSGTRLLGIGPEVLSVHVVAPYPGWSQFRPAVDEAFARYAEIAEPQSLTRVVVRYIDQILIPEGVALKEYFRALPDKLPSQPEALTSFQVTTESIDPLSGIRSLLTLVTGPSTGDHRRVIIYDLNLTRDLPTDAPLAWGDVVELLHARQKAIFEESITDKMRKLFE
jgi:uncharacterized protein (TIGR04255 family)